jgi:hypothetical protein
MPESTLTSTSDESGSWSKPVSLGGMGWGAMRFSRLGSLAPGRCGVAWHDVGLGVLTLPVLRTETRHQTGLRGRHIFLL